jgi:hypothetical protein
MGGCQCGRIEKEKIVIILQWCHSTRRNVSRDITASSIAGSLGVS